MNRRFFCNKIRLMMWMIILSLYTNILGFSLGSIEEKKHVVGVILDRTYDVSFIRRVREEIEKQGEKKDVRVIVVEATGSQEQIVQLEGMIKRKVDVIAVNSVDPQVIDTMVSRTKEEDIYFIGLDIFPTYTIKNKDKVSFIYSPEKDAGRAQARYVISQLAQKDIKEGNVAILMGDMRSELQRKRTRGVEEYLLEMAPSLNIIKRQSAHWKRQEAEDLVASWMIQDTLLAIFSNNDEMALGAVQALKTQNRTQDILIVGVGGSKEAIQGISDGNLAMTVYKNAIGFGNAVIDLAIIMISHQKFAQKIEIPFELVLKDNVAIYQKTY